MTRQEKELKAVLDYCEKKAACDDCILRKEGECIIDKDVDTAYKLVNGLEKPSDSVQSPSHYTQGSIECIDAIKASMSTEEFKGFLKGNAFKYLWRYRHKGKPEEDLDKAKWYLDKLSASIKEGKRFN